MPYIAVRTSCVLSQEQKDHLKSGLGECIALIPGKDESRLMVDIADGHTMYLAGVKRELAYVDVKCYRSADFESKKKFTEAVFELLEQVAGLAKDAVYLTCSEFENWGTLGSFK